LYLSDKAKSSGFRLTPSAALHCGNRNDKLDAGMKGPTTRYRLETVSRACQVLRLFGDAQEHLTLAEVCARTGLEKTIAFRLLHTLEAEGFVREAGANRYRSNVSIRPERPFRIGYAAQSSNTPFSDAVTRSIRSAADKRRFDLVELDNNYSVQTALRNADRLLAERVDLAIEFQSYERIATKIAARLTAAGIPLIAVDIPHPGATYFGIDNYPVGQCAGQALARAARKYWKGRVDELILLEEDAAGTLPHLRLSGAENAIRDTLPAVGRTVHLNTRGDFETAQKLVRRHLRAAPPKRTLVAAINDASSLGALRAFQEAGRLEYCAAVGVGAVREARDEIRRPGSRLVGSVAVFPERYGEAILSLAHDLLHDRKVPPVHYAEYQMINAQNVNSVYVSDLLEEPFTVVRTDSVST
jgi:ribose transport system substrate-binding protein